MSVFDQWWTEIGQHEGPSPKDIAREAWGAALSFCAGVSPLRKPATAGTEPAPADSIQDPRSPGE